MDEHDAAESINDAAIAWVVRLDRDGDHPETKAAFATWLNSHDRHRGAYLRAKAAWVTLDRASVLAGSHAGVDIQRPPADVGRRQVLVASVGAAALVALGGAGFGISRLLSGERIDTGLGEIRQLPLADGSVAALNTQSSLHIDLDPHLRRIALQHGEAWFQVAHDANRPFLVEAGDVRVRAIGTAFAVRRKEKGVDVLVTEGAVESWSEQEPERRSHITAGDRAFVSDQAGPQTVAQTSLQNDRDLAWRSGQFVFAGETLDQAVEAFNRYNRVQIRVDDRTIGGETLIGRFRINDPNSFARSAAAMLGGRLQADDDVIILSKS